jgi:signal transduction histidine kinase
MASILLFVIVGGGIGGYAAVRRLDRYDSDVRHSYEVLGTLDDVISSIKDAETGQRGFLLTGRPDYLEPYGKGVARAERAIEQLTVLTRDSPEQQRRLAQLRPLASAKIEELRQTIALRSETGFDAAREVVRTNRGKGLMDAIRGVVASFDAEEARLLDARKGSRDKAAREVTLTLLLSSLSAVALIILMIGQVDRRLNAERFARDEAERASRLQEEFIATVSHELRTPLTSILGWAQMLRAKDLAPAMEREAFEIIDRCARAQAQLIDDLLDISRISTGKMRLDVRPIALPDVIAAAVDSIRPAATARNIRLTQAIDPIAGPISGDPDRLQQVVWNLLSNAVKFTERGGRVHITVQRINSHVEIVISDSGEGIDPEFLPFVFDRFRQAETGTRRSNNGLGLGLSIVRQLVELHGGSIQAASAGKGKGATFTVQLPVLGVVVPPPVRHLLEVEKRPDFPGEAHPAIAWPDLDGVSILVVDDHDETLRMLRAALHRAGATVATASSVAEAMASFDQHTPDLVVSDIGMPHEDGHAFIQRIRARSADRGGRTPVIALTAFAGTDDRLKILSSGFQAHLSKPVHPVELAILAANLIDHGG